MGVKQAADMAQERLIATLDDYPEDGIYELILDSQSLLLIIQRGRAHLVENKCGHFGIPLQDGHLQDNEIICARHGISFALDTGEVVNRPYENCDAIRVLPIRQEKRQIFLLVANE